MFSQFVFVLKIKIKQACLRLTEAGATSPLDALADMDRDPATRRTTEPRHQLECWQPFETSMAHEGTLPAAQAAGPPAGNSSPCFHHRM